MPIGKEALLKNKPPLQVNVHHAGGLIFFPSRSCQSGEGAAGRGHDHGRQGTDGPRPTASGPTLGSLPHPPESTKQQGTVDPRARGLLPPESGLAATPRWSHVWVWPGAGGAGPSFTPSLQGAPDVMGFDSMSPEKPFPD